MWKYYFCIKIDRDTVKMVIFSTFICEKPGAGYEQKEDQVGPDDYSTSEQLVVKFSDKMVKKIFRKRITIVTLHLYVKAVLENYPNSRDVKMQLLPFASRSCCCAWSLIRKVKSKQLIHKINKFFYFYRNHASVKATDISSIRFYRIDIFKPSWRCQTSRPFSQTWTKKILLAFGKQWDKVVLHFPGCIRKPPHRDLLTIIGLIQLLSIMFRWDHK